MTIAEELGVQAVMTGKLVQRGDSLTISIELVDVLDRAIPYFLWDEPMTIAEFYVVTLKERQL